MLLTSVVSVRPGIGMSAGIHYSPAKDKRLRIMNESSRGQDEEKQGPLLQES